MGSTSNLDLQPCRRCQSPNSVIVIRAEPLCVDCFEKYIHTKIVKRLESFRVRNAPTTAGERGKKVLLSLSYGVSSLTLLHVVDRHLKRQRDRTGHTGFTLGLLHVDCSPYENTDGDDGGQSVRARIEERFPDYKIETIKITDVWDDIISTSGRDSVSSSSSITPTSSSDLTSFMASLPSTSSQTDMLLILRQRLIVQYAKTHTFQSILWGHSTTRIAERTLAETAKGRGLTIPLQVSDGPSIFDIPFYFPVRELLRKEIVAHSKMVEPTLFPLLPAHEQTKILEHERQQESERTATKQSTQSFSLIVTKNTSIDSLMMSYFDSVETGFPSIVANVVRTTDKLNRQHGPNSRLCTLCLLPIGQIEEGQKSAATVGSESATSDSSSPPSLVLCYGCRQSVSNESIALITSS